MESQLNTNEVFRALADPTRRAILGRLRAGRQPVGSLARSFPVSRPAISKHLRVLRDARLVRERREGRNRIYELDPAGIRTLRDYFEQFWTDALAAFKRAAEQPAPGQMEE